MAEGGNMVQLQDFEPEKKRCSILIFSKYPTLIFCLNQKKIVNPKPNITSFLGQSEEGF